MKFWILPFAIIVNLIQAPAFATSKAEVDAAISDYFKLFDAPRSDGNTETDPNTVEANKISQVTFQADAARELADVIVRLPNSDYNSVVAAILTGPNLTKYKDATFQLAGEIQKRVAYEKAQSDQHNSVYQMATDSFFYGAVIFFAWKTGNFFYRTEAVETAGVKASEGLAGIAGNFVDNGARGVVATGSVSSSTASSGALVVVKNTASQAKNPNFWAEFWKKFRGKENLFQRMKDAARKGKEAGINNLKETGRRIVSKEDWRRYALYHGQMMAVGASARAVEYYFDHLDQEKILPFDVLSVGKLGELCVQNRNLMTLKQRIQSQSISREEASTQYIALSKELQTLEGFFETLGLNKALAEKQDYQGKVDQVSQYVAYVKEKFDCEAVSIEEAKRVLLDLSPTIGEYLRKQESEDPNTVAKPLSNDEKEKPK